MGEEALGPATAAPPTSVGECQSEEARRGRWMVGECPHIRRGRGVGVEGSWTANHEWGGSESPFLQSLLQTCLCISSNECFIPPFKKD